MYVTPIVNYVCSMCSELFHQSLQILLFTIKISVIQYMHVIVQCWSTYSMPIKVYCNYHSVPQIRPPPFIFGTKCGWGIFIPHISPTPPSEEYSSCSRNINIKPLGCLPLKCLPWTRTARINDGHASYFAEVPSFLALQCWRLSAYRYIALGASFRLALSLHPLLTMRSCFTQLYCIGIKGLGLA